MIAFFCDFIYTGLTLLTALYYYCGLVGMEKTGFLMISAAFLPAVVLILFTHLPARGRIMLGGIVLISGIGIALAGKASDGFTLTNEYSWIPAVLVISVVSYAVGLLLARISFLRYIAGVSIVTVLVLTLLKIFILSIGYGVMYAFGLIILMTAHEIHIHWKRDGYTDEKKHIVFIAPFIILTLAVTLLFKYPDKPYDWKAFINIWNQMTAAFDRISYSFGRGSKTVTGFSDDGKLLSGVEGKIVNVLDVTTFQDMNTSVYFAGAAFDSFDGHEWTVTDDTDIAIREFDAVESVGAIFAGDGKPADYIKEIRLNIAYKGVKSKYLFAPTKVIRKEGVNRRLNVKEKGGIYTFSGYSPYHIEVSESYLKLNTDNLDFYEYMNEPCEISGYDWNEARRYLKYKDNNGPAYEDYEKYIAHIKEAYSGDIVLSPEVVAITEELYDGASGEYEKMKRLESALGSMEYSLSPGEIPGDVTDASGYLDHFLTESKSGFCAYYATAFVLLARAEGLPARYVQGYILKADKKGDFTVTSANAHAWPEVYFEGKGWIAFEPTPGFYRPSAWPMNGSAFIKIPPNAPPPTSFDHDDDAPVPADEASLEDVKTEEGFHKVNLTAILIPLILLVVFFVLFLLISRLIQRKRFEKLSREGKLMSLAKDSLSILKLLNDPLTPGETLSEYRLRIGGDVGEENLSFITDYECMLYAPARDEKINLKNAYDCRDRLLQLLRERDKLRYMIKILLD